MTRTTHSIRLSFLRLMAAGPAQVAHAPPPDGMRAPGSPLAAAPDAEALS
jgi:hypothetical protein